MSSASINPSYMAETREPSLAAFAAQRRDAGRLKFALVIPTLCEAGNICQLLDHVRSVLDPLAIEYEILVVDDDSCDGTPQVVSGLAGQDPRIRLLVRKGQRGLSGAILHGWQLTDAAVLGVMDADLQHPPELLPELISAILDDRDLAIGSRYTRGGCVGRWSPVRKFISIAAVWMTWPLQRPRLRAKDPMSGFFVVRRRCLDQMRFQRSGFKLLLEILVCARIQSMEEIPFEFGSRHRGASKANLRVALDYVALLARLYVGKLRSHVLRSQVKISRAYQKTRRSPIANQL